jgi:actin-related protein
VLDSGDGVTHSVPIFDGFYIQHASNRVDLAGRDVSENLQNLLRRGGYTFTTSVHTMRRNIGGIRDCKKDEGEEMFLESLSDPR